MKITRFFLFLLGLAAIYAWGHLIPGFRNVLPVIPALGRGIALLPSITSIGGAIFCYAYANSQYRSGRGWAAFAFFMPFLAPLILALLPDTNKPTRSDSVAAPRAATVPASASPPSASSRRSAPKGLFDSLRGGRPEEALRLIDEGADVNEMLPDGDSPLHIAAFKGYAEVAKRLIEEGANVNAKIAGGGDPWATPLHLAAMKGHVDLVSLLAENGAHVNVKLGGDGKTSTSGASPMHLAATHGMVDAARALARNGADIDAEDDYGDTPLHYAANSGMEPMVRALVGLGANLDAVDDSGRTPLSLAGNTGSVAAILREAGAKALDGDAQEHRAEGEKQKVNVMVPLDLPDFSSVELVEASALGDAGPGGQCFQNAIQFMNKGEDDGAQANFREALDKGLDPLRQGYALANAGMLLLKKNDLPGAVKDFLAVFAARRALYDSAHTAAQCLCIIMQELGRHEAAASLQGLVGATTARLGYSLAPDAAERVRSLAKGAKIARDAPQARPPKAAKAAPRAAAQKKDTIGDSISRRKLRPLGNKERLGADDYRAQFRDRDSAERFYQAFVAYSEKNPPPMLIEVMVAFTPNTIYPEKYAFILPYFDSDARSDYQEWARGAMRNCADIQRQHSYCSGNSYEYVPKSIGPKGCVFKWTIIPPKGFDPESSEMRKLLSDPPGMGFAAVPLEGEGKAAPEKPNPAGPWIDEALYGAAATRLLFDFVGQTGLSGSVIHGGDLLPDCKYWCCAIHAASQEQADIIEAAVMDSGNEKLTRDRAPVIRAEQVPVSTLPFRGFVSGDGTYVGN
jgi:ankyrin repeat protein